MEMPTFVLTGNGSYLNRGCEAIVRGTVRIIENAFYRPKIINANFDFSRRPYFPAETDKSIVHKPIVMRRWSAKWMVKQTLQRVSRRIDAVFTFRSIKDSILVSDAVLSTGGDNYTLDYGVPHNFIALDNYVRNMEKPLIIWGASIGPFDKNPAFAKCIVEHLRLKVTAFFVREEISRQYLLRNGISENVFCMGDPAFVMESESVSDNELGFSLPDNAIGLNLSPLMAKWVTLGNAKAWMHRSVEIVRNIRKNFDLPIVLIPHVTIPGQSDYKFMREVLENLGADRSGIFLIREVLTAAQTKWVISRMKCMVATRTHATIAAFSSCIPTVSLGYSVKAEGINKQVFGHTAFLIQAKNIDSDTVTNVAKNVLMAEDDIRRDLNSRIPDVKKKAFDAGLALAKILDKL